jgi:hypothetical protein
MNEMFFKQEVPGMIWGTMTVAWAKLDKVFTPDFYNYMKNPTNFNSAPAMTGDAYEDMRYALESNNVCTGWQPQHRIQFAHSKGDMVVPYGNYLAFRDAHPDGEGDVYRIDNTFSEKDHLSAGTSFLMKLAIDFIDYFAWIDASDPTSISDAPRLMNNEQLIMTHDIFDLQGRKIANSQKPTAKGIYIVNGKKVLLP